MYGLNSLPILIINFRASVRIMWIYKVFMNTLEAFKLEYKISYPKSYSNQNASIAVLFPARWYFSHALCPTTHHPDEYVYYILQIQHIIFYPIKAGYVKKNVVYEKYLKQTLRQFIAIPSVWNIMSDFENNQSTFSSISQSKHIFTCLLLKGLRRSYRILLQTHRWEKWFSPTCKII